MRALFHVGSVVMVSGFLTSEASGQVAANLPAIPAPAGALAAAAPRLPEPLEGGAVAPPNPVAGRALDHPVARVRRAPDNQWGVRNPGGVGRYLEYYPPGNQFQNPGPGVRVAQYELGPPSTSRSMQLQSQAVGISRYSVLQRHIDAYGAPRIGFFGFWPGFGFGYGYGYGMYGGGYPYPY